jgi:hypothetical protein
MQSIKISIEGDYWDSYIYMGRLYLWTFNNDLLIVNWNQLVSSLFSKTEDEFISDIFISSHSFHNESISKILKIQKVNTIISSLFQKFSNKELIITAEDIQKFLYKKQKSPFKSLTSDLEIFNKKIYAATEDGLFSSAAHRSLNEKYLVSSRPQKLWDNRLFSINASGFGQISLSGGDTGLYEYNNNEENIVQDLKKIDENIIQISESHSTFSNYSFISLYNSSTIGKAELELFNWNNINTNKKYIRKFSRKFTEEQIFKTSSESGLSWGRQDKIYRADEEGGLEVVSFNNSDEEENYFSNVKRIHLQKWKGKVLGGGVSHIGTIVECENALVVLHDNDRFTNIQGSATKWRTFPRAKNYFNQLHVIQDNSLEIYAFYNDFLDNLNTEAFKIKYIDKYLK